MMVGAVGVAIAGCGVVGSGVAQMLTDNREGISRAAGRDVALKYMVDLREVEVPKGVTLTSDFGRVLEDSEVRVLAETIGGTGVAYDYTRRALTKGISVITSNKALVAAHGDELKRLAAEHGAWYLYEAAVCGGMPVLRPLNTCLAGNRISQLSGIVNGSTNYLLTRMELDGLGFPEALGEAKALGYLEADPADDVEGYDARRKLAILTNAAFGSRLKDDALIPTEGIARLTERDLICARALHGAVKLIAHAERTGEGWTGWVHPTLVMEDNMLSSVRGVFNALTVTGDCVGDVMFHGRGAGKLPTASAVIGDLIEVVRSGCAAASVERFDDVPMFISPDKKPVEMAVRIEGALPEGLPPVLRSVQIEGMTAVLLKPVARAEGMRAIAALRERGVRAGIPLIVLQ